MRPCHLGNFGGRAASRFHWGTTDAKPVLGWSSCLCPGVHVGTLNLPHPANVHTSSHSQRAPTQAHTHSCTLTPCLRTCMHTPLHSHMHSLLHVHATHYTSHMHTAHTDRPLTYAHAHILYCTLAHTHYTLTHTFLTPTLSKHRCVSVLCHGNDLSLKILETRRTMLVFEFKCSH